VSRVQARRDERQLKRELRKDVKREPSQFAAAKQGNEFQLGGASHRWRDHG
jgi:hypothetical protein